MWKLSLLVRWVVKDLKGEDCSIFQGTSLESFETIANACAVGILSVQKMNCF